MNTEMNIQDIQRRAANLINRFIVINSNRLIFGRLE